MKRLQPEADDKTDVDWAVQYVDKLVVRAHAHVAVAKRGLADEALRYSRGGFSTMIRLWAEGEGRPLNFVFIRAQRPSARSWRR